MHFKHISLFMLVANLSTLSAMEFPTQQQKIELLHLPQEIIWTITLQVIQDSLPSLTCLSRTNTFMNNFVRTCIEKNKDQFIAAKKKEKKDFLLLMIKIYQEDFDIVPHLHPLRLNKIDPHIDKTLLMEAAFYNRPKNVAAILAAGADPNVKNCNGWTACMFATQRPFNASVVKMLTEHGADWTLKNKRGETAFDIEREAAFEYDRLKEANKSFSAGSGGDVDLG